MKWWHLVVVGLLSGIGFALGARAVNSTVDRLAP